MGHLEHPDAPLIVVAMMSELRHALETVSASGSERFGPWRCWEAELNGRPLNFVLSGIGMVNAGAALARMLGAASPEYVLNYGCAGAHREDINPGDVVVGSRYVHHRASTILPDGTERHAYTPISPEDTSVMVTGFDANPRLLHVARQATEGWRPDPWHVAAATSEQGSVYFGPVASADSWTQSTRHITRIFDEHETLCEDMEAAALTQICWMHEIPFLAIKDISNNEFQNRTDHGTLGGPTLEEVEHEVGRRAFELVRRVIERME